MGFLDKQRQAEADKKADKAQEAWDAGLRAYVLRVEAFSKNAEGRLLPQLDGILAIGWQLHSTAALMNTAGINTEVVIFTFLRPA